ncbi:N-terminal [Zea mays]|uniref:N-terminal n=1 Tax=Zea mays TaxID=4577 RepID=A0A1D6ET60_MAIZE|nr:N-terminal [Zea mays]ONM22909.1 N-terminal [Zea mays]
MAKSCKGLAMELVKCLSETDCVKVQKRPYKECAGEKVPNITSECVGLRETYFNCKRGQVCPDPCKLLVLVIASFLLIGHTANRSAR